MRPNRPLLSGWPVASDCIGRGTGQYRQMRRQSVLPSGALFSILLAASACNSPGPAVSDAEMSMIKRENSGMAGECLSKIRDGGFKDSPLRTDECFEMEPPRRWKGLWSRGFEQSLFCPEPVRNCKGHTPGGIWLTPNRSLPPDLGDVDKPCGRPWGNERTFVIDFVGRKTRSPGKYGHMGQSSHEIIVDRVNSVFQVGPQRGCP